nr:MAG TPA: hypothetical protein [Caudoviricetes sp.]
MVTLLLREVGLILFNFMLIFSFPKDIIQKKYKRRDFISM